MASMNQERKTLERKIFDLEIEMMNQKRNSDKTIGSIASSLKSLE